MDTISIRGLKIQTTIGTLSWERHIQQTVLLDLELGTDIKKAAQTDNLEFTLDYAGTSQKLIQFIEASSFQLIETLAEKTTEFLFEHCPSILQIKLTVKKPGAVKEASEVSVSVERTRR